MNKLLFLILTISFLVRFVGLEKSPPALFSDEVDVGVQARSLIETGRDYMGVKSPFYIRSYNSDRTPIPIYLASITTRVFSSPILQVRMPFVLAGVLIVFLSYQIVLIITKSKLAAIWTALISAINPWQIQFSRIAFETIISLSILMLAIWIFLLWLENKSKKLIFLSVFLLGLTVYSYRTMTLFAPLILLTMSLIFLSDLRKLQNQTLAKIIMVFLLIYGGFVYKTVIKPNDQTRISQISIFSDPLTKIWIQRNREIDSGDLVDSTIGKKAVLSSFFFHNKYLSWGESFRNNYLEAFSTNFLFISGDPNLRHSPDGGLMLLPDLIGIIAGVLFILRNLRSNKKYQFLLIWLLLSPLPSCLTNDGGGGHHASRLLLISGPLIMLIGIGWWRLVCSKLMTYTVLAMYILTFVFYYHNYFVHYPIKASRNFGYGYEQSIDKIKDIVSKGEFDSLNLSTSIDPPLPYLWFWNKVDVTKLQRNGLSFAGEIKGLKNINTVNWAGLKDEYKDWTKILQDKNIYLITERDVRPDELGDEITKDRVTLLGTIKYPDNEPAFYIITKGKLGSLPQ